MADMAGFITIKGSIKPSFEDDHTGEESESDNDDVGNILLDGNVVKSKRPKETKVNITTAAKKTEKCSGRFPFLQNFWTVEGKFDKKRKNLRSSPVYSLPENNPLQKDNDKANFHNIFIFLNDCLKEPTKAKLRPDVQSATKKGKLHLDIQNATKGCFDSYLSHAKPPKPSLQNLESLLCTYFVYERAKCSLSYTKASDFKADDHSKFMEAFVFESDLGITVFTSVSHPQLVRTLCELFPNSFSSMLLMIHKSDATSHSKSGGQGGPGGCCQDEDDDDDDDDGGWMGKELMAKKMMLKPNMDKAQVMATETPWEFGFKQILKKKLNVLGIEASVDMFIKAGYMSHIPQAEKDALYIYHVLKANSKKFGHVYMPFKLLKRDNNFEEMNHKIYGNERWTSALEYLEHHEVVKIEEFNGDSQVFLHHLWKAEVDVVLGFKHILTRHHREPLTWHLDLEGPDFARMRDDPDQQRALELMARLPITVLSGRGGCGKTTVVTTLLQHLCARAHEDESDSDSESPHCETQEVEEQRMCLKEKSLGTLPETKTNEAVSIFQAEKSQPDPPRNRNAYNSVDEYRRGLQNAVISDLLKILATTCETDSTAVKNFKAKIVLTAPTGKAAKLLEVKSKLPSGTLHSILMSWKSYQKQLEKPNPWKYSKVEILVVDECSLVSTCLCAKVLNCLIEHANLRKLILLGDVRQMPSISPGNFLNDIFQGLRNNEMKLELSMELRQNHRAESELIVKNAGLISDRRLPEIDSERNFHFIELPRDADDNKRDEIIRNILADCPDVTDHIKSQFVTFRNAHCEAINSLCCHHYNSHPITSAGSHVKKKHFDFQVGDKICLKKNKQVRNHRKVLLRYDKVDDAVHSIAQKSRHCREGASPQASCVKRLEKSVLDNTAAASLIMEEDDEVFDKTVAEMKESDEKAAQQKKARDKRYREQSKQKSNTETVDDEDDDEQKTSVLDVLGKEEEKLCNGEIFFIMDETTTIDNEGTHTSYVLSDQDPHLPRVVCVDSKDLRKHCKMQHSWVRTIHTYQGSESETVIYYLGAAIPQDWQHVYTAVTRGRRSVYVIGKWSEFQIAVERRPVPRRTRLDARLKDLIIDKKDLVGSLHSCVIAPLEDELNSSDDSFLLSTCDPTVCESPIPQFSKLKKKVCSKSTKENGAKNIEPGFASQFQDFLPFVKKDLSSKWKKKPQATPLQQSNSKVKQTANMDEFSDDDDDSWVHSVLDPTSTDLETQPPEHLETQPPEHFTDDDDHIQKQHQEESDNDLFNDEEETDEEEEELILHKPVLQRCVPRTPPKNDISNTSNRKSNKYSTNRTLSSETPVLLSLKTSPRTPGTSTQTSPRTTRTSPFRPHISDPLAHSHSPVKVRKLEHQLVGQNPSEPNTPFREAFSQTLSLSCEDDSHNTESKKHSRKLFQN